MVAIRQVFKLLQQYVSFIFFIVSQKYGQSKYFSIFWAIFHILSSYLDRENLSDKLFIGNSFCVSRFSLLVHSCDLLPKTNATVAVRFLLLYPAASFSLVKFIVNIRATHRAVVFLALLLWLMTGCMGVHSQFCFDGQEPAFSLHVDIPEGHEAHSDEEVHQDLDLSQSAFIKLLKLYSASIFILVAAIAVTLSANSPRLFIYSSIYFIRFLPTSDLRFAPRLRQ